MILCGGCSKTIKTRGKYLRTCKKCGHAICKCCNVEGYCTGCHPANNDRNVVYEYFREKYTKSILRKPITSLMFVLLLIMALSVNGSTLAYETRMVEKDCEWNNYPTYEYEPVFTSELVYHDKNDTWENKTTFVEYALSETIDDYRLKCDSYIQNGNKYIDYKLKGYNCKESGGEIICDSCTDGNCDGVCSPNGGETCVKITASQVIHKNSETVWKDTPINTERLDVR